MYDWGWGFVDGGVDGSSIARNQGFTEVNLMAKVLQVELADLS